jgi:hypothetical protein
MLKRLLVWSAFALLLSTSLRAEPYHLLSLALYQPEATLEQRVGTNVDMVSYVKALNAAAVAYFDALPPGHPGILNLVIAFKPSGKSKVWLVPQDTKIDKPADLIKKLEAVPAPKANGGPIAFCLHASLWGGTDATPFTQPPYPDEWLNASPSSLKPLLIPDGVLDAIWKD